MIWRDLKKHQPIDTQLILVYTIAMDPEEWIELGIWPFMIWNEKENKAQDYDGTFFVITHWTPLTLPAGLKFNAPKDIK